MITFVLPTRNRPTELHETLAALGALAGLEGEVFVVDNASSPQADAPGTLPNGMPVRLVRLEENLGAAARNLGVRSAHPDSEWVVLLDDDSAPIDAGFVDSLASQPVDVGAVMADITLPDGSRERGGLPEVFIGCGVAVRRWAFLAAGGYDESFGYYAEEYDLAAKLIQADRRIVFDPRFRVLHRKVNSGRDMGVILERLVRNNGWVLQRHCPDEHLEAMLDENERRYRAIAEKESAVEGFERGLGELRATLAEQARLPMANDLWDRFTGLDAARRALGGAHRERAFRAAAIVAGGKNEWVVRRALEELGVEVVSDESSADRLVVGTMSPGPMLDALEGAGDDGRVLIAWSPASEQPRFTRFGGVELRRAAAGRPAA
ncbi:MAG: glycosyltransferase family 2 protein [Phycisphaerales bacterium JB040]